MDTTQNTKTLELWNHIFQGIIKENILTFDNELAVGSIESVWINEDMEILKVDYTLRRGISFTQKRFTTPETDFIPVLFGEPVSDSLTLEGGKTLKTSGIAAFCSNSYESLGLKHSTSTVGKNTKFLSVRLRKSLFNKYVSRSQANVKAFDPNSSFFMYEEFDPGMRMIYDRTFEINTTVEYANDFYDSFAKLLVTKFFQMVNDRQVLKEKNKHPKNLQPVMKAREILSDISNKDIDLDSLAKECGLSGSRLRFLFKETFGMTIHQFHNDYKLDVSRKMLMEGQRSIMMIALDVGFSSSSHFTTAFKKKYNTTPKEFKNSLTDNKYVN